MLLPLASPTPIDFPTLSLHDALPISLSSGSTRLLGQVGIRSFVGAVLTQFFQLLCLTVGNRLLSPLLVKSMQIGPPTMTLDRKSTRLNSSHRCISYAVFCLKTKNTAE